MLLSFYVFQFYSTNNFPADERRLRTAESADLMNYLRESAKEISVISGKNCKPNRLISHLLHGDLFVYCINMNKPVIYTIGHSNHPADYFLELLKAFAVNCLIDVRSTAASAYNPHFNKGPLSNFLKNNRITYLHFAEEFGARYTDPDLLDDEGKVSFDKVRKGWHFKNGVERLWAGIDKGFTIALMCSESEPFDCHRFSMISVALSKDGFEVKHILKDKSLLDNEELEKQLLKKYSSKLPKPDMFNPNITKEDQLKAAYQLRNKDIAFSPYDKQSVAEHD